MPTAGWKERQKHRAGEVRRIRQRLGMTQAAFAEKMGVDSNTVSRWELGTRRIGQPSMRLARMLGKNGH